MRLVDADEFLGVIARMCTKVCDLENCDNQFPNCGECKVHFIYEMLKKAPTIEAKPVVHAHWEERLEVKDEHFECYSIFCSNCKELLYGSLEHSKFCSHCGAQMDEDRIADTGKKEGEWNV